MFEERASGTKAHRPGLAQTLNYVRAGNAIVVWKLDRLGRSMAQLIETVRALGAKGVGFRSLTEAVGTTTLGGTLIFPPVWSTRPVRARPDPRAHERRPEDG